MDLRFQKKLKFLLIFIFTFLIFGGHKEVLAGQYEGHDTYYLDVSIDNSKERYSYDVIDDTNKSGKSMERDTEYYWFGHFVDSGIFLDSSGKAVVKSIGTLNENKEFSITTPTGTKFSKDKVKLMYSFPAAQSHSIPDRRGEDQQRADTVGRTLTSSLNSVITAIDALDGSYDIKSSMELLEASTLLNKTAYTENNIDGFQAYKIDNYCYIYYGVDTTNPHAYNYKNGEFRAYIVPWKKTVTDKDLSENYSFVWAMQKGYMNLNGEAKQLYQLESFGNLTHTHVDDGEDASLITIFNVADTANYKFYLTFTGQSVDKKEDGNFVSDLLTGLFRSIILGLQNLLGLDSIYDLVYNGNSIGTETHENGMMNSVWWSIMLKYHLIFQVVAWMVIGLAVAKILIELNFSTINPKLRMSIMEMFQKLFVVGFLLVLTIPLMKLMSGLNNDIVAIFKTQAQQDADAFTVGNGLAQVFAYAGYFGILVSINCVYIMRSIMLAILGASAPLFIVSMAFSKGQGLFSQWLKEVVANIFIQSVHAFTLAFLFEILNKGGMLQQLVILFSLMPITDTFRSWIFGQSGSFASSTGQKLGGAIASTTKNVAKGVAGGVINKGVDGMKEKYNLDSDAQGSSGGKSGGGGGSSYGGKGEGSLSNASSALSARGTQLKKEEQTLGSRLDNAQKFGKDKGLVGNVIAAGSKANAVLGSSGVASALGKASAISSNLGSSFETMGDMMSQGNSGDYNGMSKSGQQLAQNVSEASYAATGTAGSIGGGAKNIAKAHIQAAINKDEKYGTNGFSSRVSEASSRNKMNAYNKRHGIGREFTNANNESCLKIPSDAYSTVGGVTKITDEYIEANRAKYPALDDYMGQTIRKSSDGSGILNLSKVNEDKEKSRRSESYMNNSGPSIQDIKNTEEERKGTNHIKEKENI